jgi:hypothetical protein
MHCLFYQRAFRETGASMQGQAYKTFFFKIQPFPKSFGISSIGELVFGVSNYQTEITLFIHNFD